MRGTMSKYINSLLQMSAVSVVLMSAAFADQNQCCKPCPPCIPPCIPIDLCYSYPLLQNGYMVHMDVGYILEQFVLTNTDFAYTTDNFDTVPQTVKMLRPKFNVASGVTAELGFYFEHDHWFVNSRFDWVSRKGKKSWSASDADDAVVPVGIWTEDVFGVGEDATYFTDVSESLRVSYYDLQIDLNRGTFLTHHLAIEPHAGLKAAWIYYKGDQEYSGGPFTGTLDHDQKTTFWGVGPDFGVNSDWRFGDGFGMYLDSTVAILCGGANVKDRLELGTSTGCECSDSEDSLTYVKQNRIVMSPTARAMFGFQYNSGMFDSSQNLRIRVGCDAAYYWNQFQHIDVRSGSDGVAGLFTGVDNGGFGMIGLMIELGWDF